VAREPEPPQAPETMTPNQLARRARVIDAVLALVHEGATEDMQMKDIADRAGVALGTIYRYFSSKDHVFGAALVEWARDLDRRTTRRPASDGSPADQLVAVLHQALRAYQREPTFARLLILVANSSDPYAGECYRQMGPVVFAALGRAIEGFDAPADTAERVLNLIGAVWYHGLVEWVNGRMTIDDVANALDSAARHLVNVATYAAR
jgi:AcrR family transcriptional regulator